MVIWSLSEGSTGLIRIDTTHLAINDTKASKDGLEIHEGVGENYLEGMR